MSNTQPNGNFDQELNTKLQDKINDPQRINNLLTWIYCITGIQHGSLKELKDGVTLCVLLNVIRPGTVGLITDKPNMHVLEERENIQKYLAGCVSIGLESDFLFRVDDLHSFKYLLGVVENVEALDRLCQQMAVPDIPVLGVRYYRTKEQEEAIKTRRLNDKKREYERRKTVDEKALKRRLELVKEKKQVVLNEQISIKERADQRQLTRRNTLTESDLRSRKPAKTGIRDRSISPVRYGMDKESHEKLKLKKDPKLEEQAMNWLEEVTNECVNDLFTSLYDGVLLCRAINAIRPGMIKEKDYYENSSNGFHHLANIEIFLKSCRKLGLSPLDLFEKNDLHKGKDINAVIHTIHTLASVVPYTNPNLITMEDAIAIYEEGADRYTLQEERSKIASIALKNRVEMIGQSDSRKSPKKTYLELEQENAFLRSHIHTLTKQVHIETSTEGWNKEINMIESKLEATKAKLKADREDCLQMLKQIDQEKKRVKATKGINHFLGLITLISIPTICFLSYHYYKNNSK